VRGKKKLHVLETGRGQGNVEAQNDEEEERNGKPIQKMCRDQGSGEVKKKRCHRKKTAR